MKNAIGNTTAGIKLAGTLTMPNTGGPFPAVVLITGSGPQNRDETLLGHKPFVVLADYLTRRGIAVLRCDDRGIGKSTGEAIVKNRDLQKRLFAVIKQEQDDTEATRKMRPILQHALSELTDDEKKAAGFTSTNIDTLLQIQSKQVLSPWFRYFLVYDPQPALKKLKCPVLAINGEKDLQVPPKENLSAIEKALKADGIREDRGNHRAGRFADHGRLDWGTVEMVKFFKFRTPSLKKKNFDYYAGREGIVWLSGVAQKRLRRSYLRLPGWNFEPYGPAIDGGKEKRRCSLPSFLLALLNHQK